MPPTDYPVMFRTMMVRGTQAALERVQQHPDLPAEERDQALHMLTYALDLTEAWAVTRDLLLFLAPRMDQAGHRETWIPFLESGIRQSEEIQDEAAAANLRFYVGLLYQSQARFDEARREYEQSLTYFQKHGEQEQQARLLNRMAAMARLQKRYDEALSLAHQALDQAKHSVTEQAYSYLVFANVAFDRYEWLQAKQFYERSLALWRQANDPRMIGWGLVNLGTSLRAMGKHEEAIHAYTEALDILTAVKDPISVAVAQNNLGIAHFHLNHFDEALEWYLKAEPTFRNAQDHTRSVRLWVNLGILYLQQQQWEAARRWFEASFQGYRAMEDVIGQANVLDGLGLVACGEGDYRRAVTTFQQGLALLATIPLSPDDALVQELTDHLRDAQSHLPNLPDE